MRIAIIADSHDQMDNLRRAIDICRQEEVETLLHAGDFIAPFAVKALAEVGCPVHAVFGNNDGERLGIRDAFGDWGRVQPGPVELTLAGKRILLMHEPYALASHEASNRSDLIIYGHTHESEWRPRSGDGSGGLVINPGEVCGWVTGRATFALFDLQKGDGRLVDIV
ncbi:MAG: metallophosphoesterase [Acidobacteriota bacterium]